MSTLSPIAWIGNADTGCLRLLDQTKLPGQTTSINCRDLPTLHDAIKRLVVRGAPAIGVAAGYGCVIAVQGARDESHARQALHEGAAYLATSRPTARNLFWALERMQRVAGQGPCTAAALLVEAQRIHDEDADMCRRIGEFGLAILERHLSDRPADGQGVLTHCNAGALATGGIGTATAPLYLAHQRGKKFTVYADETRPLLQGSRLTAFELAAAGIDVVLICDNMAAQVLREGKVAMVIVGADRIAANGDAANKIGTYSLAINARHHRVPFYVAAPSSTFDLTLEDGSAIPIEERPPEEITQGFGPRTAPADIRTYSPAFDVTPHELITGIITERGVISPVDTHHVKSLMHAIR